MTSDEKRFIQAYGLQGRNQIMKSHFPDEVFL